MENILDCHISAYEGGNVYDFDNEILLNWYPQRILEHTTGMRSMLELGLGHGYTTNIFSGRYERHVVLDGSPAVIRNFHKRYPDSKAKIIETYFEDFDSNERFDVIVMGFILEHVDDPLVVVNHYKKFLNKGGKMYVAVPNAEVLNRRLGNLSGLLPNIFSLSDHDRLLGHKRYYTVRTLTDELSTAGYDITKIEGIYLKPLTTQQIVSLNLNNAIINALCKLGIEYPELSCGILVELKLKE